MRFWLDMGVDGLRLDAIPYLVERDGTNCENLPETHEIVKRSRREIDANYATTGCYWRRPINGRAMFATTSGTRTSSTWPSTFPLMPRMFMALRLEDRHPDRRHHGPHAARFRQLPMGTVPAQSR